MPTRPDMNTRVDAPVDPRVAWRMTLHQALQLVLNENDNQWMTVRGPEESRNARYQLGTNFSAVCLSTEFAGPDCALGGLSVRDPPAHR